jgi:hypothetical protein
MHTVLIIDIKSSREPTHFWITGAKPNNPGRQAPQNGQRSSATPISLPHFGHSIDPVVWRMAEQNTGRAARGRVAHVLDSALPRFHRPSPRPISW